MSESVFDAADLLLVPLVRFTLRTLEQLQAFLATQPERAPALLAFFSMVDRRKRLHREVVASLPAALPEIGAAIVPSASVVELLGPRRAPVVVTHPSAPAARAYAALWAEVRGALDGASADGLG